MDNADESLCELLGISSFDPFGDSSSDGDGDKEIQRTLSPSGIPLVDRESIRSVLQLDSSRDVYESESVYVFPSALSLPAITMRRITDELLWGGDGVLCDKSYESITYIKNGQMHHRRELTRLENFVNGHGVWNELCRGYLQTCLSELVGEDTVLYKEKLNLKPPGGSGFAPHLDTPSLRMALGREGPNTFFTVMVAIDDMNVKNGCLRVVKGPWSEECHCDVTAPEMDGNPDAGGRAGALAIKTAETQAYEDIVCKGGDIVVFNGWVPHRSAANTSPFPRRAVFLTYNLWKEGDFHDEYYRRMKQMRTGWHKRNGVARLIQIPEEEEEGLEAELEALTTIPKI